MTQDEKKISDNNYYWWEDLKNKTTFDFPISIAQEGKYYCATFNNETNKLLGESLGACSQAKTKEESIKQLFDLVRMTHDYADECRRSYQRWVPFRKGDWSHIGGTWFVIYGIHFNFRYGKGMRYGRYIPFTKLNISISNEWNAYRKYKKSLKP